jgi:hypothetical protein
MRVGVSIAGSHFKEQLLALVEVVIANNVSDLRTWRPCAKLFNFVGNFEKVRI